MNISSAGQQPRIAEAGWLLLLVLIPISFDRFAAFPFDWHKAALLRSVVAIIFCIWLYQYWRYPDNRTGPHSVYAALFFLLLSESISTLFSLAPLLSLAGSLHRGSGLLTTLAFAGLFIVAAQGLQWGPARDRLVTALLAVSLPVALYALVQNLEADPLFWAGNVAYRAASTIGNPIFLSAFLNFSFLMGLARLLQLFHAPANTMRNRNAPLYLALLLVQLWAIWSSQSRGPVLALVVGLVTLVLATNPPARPPIRRVLVGLSQSFLIVTLSLSVALALVLVVNAHWFASLLSLVVTVLLVVLVSRFRLGLMLPSGMLLAALALIFSFAFQIRVEPPAPVASVDTPAGMGVTPLTRTLNRVGSARERIQYWQGYRDTFLRTEPIKLLKAEQGVSIYADSRDKLRPWLGYGPEMAGDVLSQNYPLKLGAGHSLSMKIDRAHNAVWDRLVNHGILGLISWLAFMVVLIDLALKRLGRRISQRLRWSSWAASVIGVFAASSALGSEFFGLCLQLGLVFGALLQISLSRSTRKADWITSAALAAILMHLSETSVGIPVTSTEMLFWLCAALVASTPSEPTKTGNVPARTTGALLAVIVGGLAFSFLGVGGVPQIGESGLLMIATPFVSSVAGWLATITGSTWQSGSAAGLIALYAGMFGLGTIGMALLFNHRILSSTADLLLVFKSGWPLLVLAVVLIWAWQWNLATRPVLLTWNDEAALTNAAVAHAEALVLRVPFFFMWVLTSLLWLAFCISPSTDSQAHPFPASRTLIAVLCGAALTYLVSIRPGMASSHAHHAKRWGSGDLQTWLALNGRKLETIYQAALVTMQKAVQLAPGRPEFRVAVAEMSAWAGRSDGEGCDIQTPAHRSLYEAVRLHPADVIALQGLILLSQRRLLDTPEPEQREAWATCTLNHFRLLQSYSPRHPQVPAEMGRFALQALKNPALADKFSGDALRLHPDTQIAIRTRVELARWRRQRSCRVQNNECDQANRDLTSWLERTMRVNPKRLEYRLMLIDQYLAAGDTPLAHSTLIDGLVNDQDNKTAHTRLLGKARQADAPGQSLNMINAALTHAPASTSLQLTRIELLVEEKIFDEAAASLRAMLDSGLLGNRLAARAARLFIRIGDIASANEAYRLALVSAPGDAGVWLEAARFSIAGDDRASAEVLLEHAAAHAGNRLQAIEIEKLRMSNYQAQSAVDELLTSKARLQALKGANP